MDLSARLDPRDLADVLPRLRFRDDDAAATLAAVPEVLADEESRARLADMVDRLGSRGADVCAPSVFTDDDSPHQLGDGVLPLLALLATRGEALARHTARGIGDDVARESLSDLGQQVWVHRQVHGSFGLHNQGWLGGNWAGGLVWLGRLQFDVEPTKAGVPGFPAGTPAFFCHIPETGPLRPADVDASLAWAREVLPRWYPEVTAPGIHCVSWLLDPTVSQLLPDSNIARFASRFEPWGLDSCGVRDATYFGFHREQPCDVAELPRDNAFQRAIAEHLCAGGTIRITAGRLK